ncbi:HAD-IA family hydrolase [uncultured Deefgea sp.]|uniref:HAD-IA family hydrolase n=1 Tax=uncultured Deefgea sp. TaxID=1304914 RepID=UPI002595E36C|nr:HAD-IA family hydrolase [uncultured Deefgea sp.]
MLQLKQWKARGILFDMDGTLIDSTAKVEQIWRTWCERHDVDLAAVMAIQQGVRSEDTIRAVAPHLDVAAECRWIDEMESADCDGIVVIPGARSFLAKIPSARWTIATSASVAPAIARLNFCHIPIPATMVCADHVSLGKPAPEIYRLAAARIGLSPSDCIAFEDAPAGVLSALSAGCQVIQIGGQQPLHPDVLAVFADFQHLDIEIKDELLISLRE